MRHKPDYETKRTLWEIAVSEGSNLDTNPSFLLMRTSKNDKTHKWIKFKCHAYAPEVDDDGSLLEEKKVMKLLHPMDT